MTLEVIFVISGVMVAVLILGKAWQEKTSKSFFLLRTISRGDEHIRGFSHELTHRYAELKEKTHFFARKQIPLHSKNFLNKSSVFLKEQTEKYIGNIRGSKLLKKNDGISEFFKKIGDEETNGRIEEEI